MSTAIERDRIFFDVPLSEAALDQLYEIAKQEETQPVHILRKIVVEYQVNGKPPMPEELTGVYRGIPLTHAFLRDVKEMAAQYKKSPIVILKGIVEEELRRRAPAPALTGAG